MADGYAAQDPDGIAALVARVRKLEQRLDAQRSALAGIGLHIDGVTGNLIIDANAAMSANFDGTLSPPAAGNNGWAGTGAAFIVNTLIAKNAIIDDDALNNPLAVGSADGTTTGITLPTSEGTLHTESVSVPAGFTQSIVLAIAQVGGQNPLGSGQFVSTRARINGVSGDNILTSIDSTAVDHGTAFFVDVLSGLSGSFNVDARGLCTAGGFTGATARVSAMAIFLR